MISRRRFLEMAGGAALAGWPGTVRSASEPFVELVARPGTSGFLGDDAPDVPIWGYNGLVPGPTIRARRGDTVRVRLINELTEPTSIHWHGIRIDNRMDGVAGLTQDPVEPGERFDYVFTVPDAGTFWYHSHNRSWEQVDRGLYGALIVDDDTAAFDPDHDITLVLDDWRVSQSGRIDEGFGDLGDWSHGGRLGNWPTINGLTQPEISLNGNGPTRVRLVNAANARIFELDLEGIGAEIIAYDGQSLNRPEKPPYNPMLLGPAQRMDIVLAPSMAGGIPLLEMSGQPFELARFVATAGTAGPRRLDLAPNTLPEPEIANARVYDLHMEGGMMGGMVGAVVDGEYLEGEALFRSKQVWAFNGVAGLADKPYFHAATGESVVVRVVNDTAFPHAMHVHGHHFKVIERSDSTVAHTPWRDTFMIGPAQTTRIAFVADNPGKWLFHCHMLEHQAAGMKTWFAVG